MKKVLLALSLSAYASVAAQAQSGYNNNGFASGYDGPGSTYWNNNVAGSNTYGPTYNGGYSGSATTYSDPASGVSRTTFSGGGSATTYTDSASGVSRTTYKY